MPKRSIEDEVDEIKLRIYEEIKDMTSQEIGDHYRKAGDAIVERYYLSPSRSGRVELVKNKGYGASRPFGQLKVC